MLTVAGANCRRVLGAVALLLAAAAPGAAQVGVGPAPGTLVPDSTGWGPPLGRVSRPRHGELPPPSIGPCFGYSPTCWHRWPEGCPGCPNCPAAMEPAATPFQETEMVPSGPPDTGLQLRPSAPPRPKVHPAPVAPPGPEPGPGPVRPGAGPLPGDRLPSVIQSQPVSSSSVAPRLPDPVIPPTSGAPADASAVPATNPAEPKADVPGAAPVATVPGVPIAPAPVTVVPAMPAPATALPVSPEPRSVEPASSEPGKPEIPEPSKPKPSKPETSEPETAAPEAPAVRPSEPEASSLPPGILSAASPPPQPQSPLPERKLAAAALRPANRQPQGLPPIGPPEAATRSLPSSRKQPVPQVARERMVKPAPKPERREASISEEGLGLIAAMPTSPQPAVRPKAKLRQPQAMSVLSETELDWPSNSSLLAADLPNPPEPSRPKRALAKSAAPISALPKSAPPQPIPTRVTPQQSVPPVPAMAPPDSPAAESAGLQPRPARPSSRRVIRE